MEEEMHVFTKTPKYHIVINSFYEDDLHTNTTNMKLPKETRINMNDEKNNSLKVMG